MSLSNPEVLEGQAQGGEEDRTTMLRVMVRYSNHEVLEGSVTHHECSYEPRVDTWAMHVTSAQDRICLDYFYRIGVSCQAVLCDPCWSG